MEDRNAAARDFCSEMVTEFLLLNQTIETNNSLNKEKGPKLASLNVYGHRNVNQNIMRIAERGMSALAPAPLRIRLQVVFGRRLRSSEAELDKN
ncbi:unnamed protein product [Leptosia nina]|uniref:Uncharacterized protein n=1 Tax=Leptosia nina TaxID=320188 RepID=A0AAV1K6C5_9NEOP